MGGIGRGQGGDELFAAIAGQQIVTPLQAAIKDGSHRLQATIAFRVAVGVIEPFEVVDVDHQYRQPESLDEAAAAAFARVMAALEPIRRPAETKPRLTDPAKARLREAKVGSKRR